jgi:hypothetical protein
LAVVVALATATAAGLTAEGASGARRASAAERSALRHLIVAACRRGSAPGAPCRLGTVRVSTVNPRFAWAESRGGDGFTAALVKRPHRTGGRWRIVAIQGGGIENCSKWERHAPRRVVRDLRLDGLRPGGTSGGRCD